MGGMNKGRPASNAGVGAAIKSKCGRNPASPTPSIPSPAGRTVPTGTGMGGT